MQALGGLTRITVMIMILTLCGLVAWDHIHASGNEQFPLLFKEILLFLLGKFANQSGVETMKNIPAKNDIIDRG